ncbi:hypothetical protein ACLKMH_09990 [Psychromonas sp. KJ10-10]
MLINIKHHHSRFSLEASMMMLSMIGGVNYIGEMGLSEINI